MSTLTENFLS